MELTVAEISQKLADQAQSVCGVLLPGGKIHGNEWCCGNLDGGPGDSLKVCLTGRYAGQWRDWASNDDKGDLIDLWRMVKGLTPADAVKAAKGFLGIVDPVRVYERKSYSKPPEAITAPLASDGGAFKYLTGKRKLTPAVVAALRIEGSKERGAIVFQSFSPAGELVNRSYRTLTEPKKVWQDKGCAPSLFGWQALPQSAYTARTVLLSEGQIDCASWHVWGIPALSIPNGSGATWVDFEWDNLAPFDTIYLAFDADAGGKNITENIATRLGKHRCLIVVLPKKDANACLQHGYTAEDAQSWIEAARPPKIKRLVTSADLEERLAVEIREKPKAFTLPFLDISWPHQGFYFRPGEVTIWGGYAFAGKSTMLNFMLSNLMQEEANTFIASFETKAESVLQRLATIWFGDSLDDPKARAFAKLAGERVVFADLVGSMGEAELIEMMWFAFRRYGCTHFIIDSLMRIEGLEEEYVKQGEFLAKLQTFVTDTGAHVHLVAHLRKPSASKDRPSMWDIKGSNNLAGNANNVLLVARNPEKEKLRKAGQMTPDKERIMHDTEVIIEKQRDSGWIGLFRLKFNPHRYSYSKI